MMIVRYLVMALVAGINLITVASVEARGTALTRQQIKSTPILERPSRVGHFYGNTVRRRANRETSRSTEYAPSVSNASITPMSGGGISPMSLLGRSVEY